MKAIACELRGFRANEGGRPCSLGCRLRRAGVRANLGLTPPSSCGKRVPMRLCPRVCLSADFRVPRRMRQSHGGCCADAGSPFGEAGLLGHGLLGSELRSSAVVYCR